MQRGFVQAQQANLLIQWTNQRDTRYLRIPFRYESGIYKSVAHGEGRGRTSRTEHAMMARSNFSGEIEGRPMRE